MIPIKQDIRTESKYKKIVMLFAVLFFIAAFSCQGQIQRYYRYENMPDIRTISPVKPIKLESKYGEIKFSLSMDSVRYEYTPVYLYAYFPKTYKDFNNSITIGFESGQSRTFLVDLVDCPKDEQPYVEYKVGCGTDLSNMLITEAITYIQFNGLKPFIIVDDRRVFFRKFFIEALANYK